MYFKTHNVKMCIGFSWLSMSEVVQYDRRHGECEVIIVRAIQAYRDVKEYLRLLYLGTEWSEWSGFPASRFIPGNNPRTIEQEGWWAAKEIILCTTKTCGCVQELFWHSLVFIKKTAVFIFRVKICLIDKGSGFLQNGNTHLPNQTASHSRRPCSCRETLTCHSVTCRLRVSCSTYSNPSAALDRPECSRRLRIPDFKTVGT